MTKDDDTVQQSATINVAASTSISLLGQCITLRRPSARCSRSDHHGTQTTSAPRQRDLRLGPMRRKSPRSHRTIFTAACRDWLVPFLHSELHLGGRGNKLHGFDQENRFLIDHIVSLHPAAAPAPGFPCPTHMPVATSARRSSRHCFSLGHPSVSSNLP